MRKGNQFLALLFISKGRMMGLQLQKLVHLVLQLRQRASGLAPDKFYFKIKEN
jgi:hypothetical protein